MKKILVLFGVLVFCALITACSHNSYTVLSPNGKNEMTITCKTQEECKVTWPSSNTKEPKQHKLKDIVLIVNNERHAIDKVPKGTEIETSLNPDCRWRFVGNQAFYICN